MVKNVIAALVNAARALFTNWRTLASFVLVYAGLLASLYYFFTLSEARLWQVGVSLLLALVAPALFFAWQAMAVSYAQEGGARLVVAARQFWKLLVVSLPILVVAWLFSFAIGKAGQAMSQHGDGWPTGAKGTALSGLWGLVMYVALPLVAAHVWIAAVRTGIGPTFKGYGRSVVRAFSPRSILTYVVGMIFFIAIPYALIVPRVPMKNAWADLILLGARLALALAFIFVGWVVTLGALSRLKFESLSQVSAPPMTSPKAPALPQL